MPNDRVSIMVGVRSAFLCETLCERRSASLRDAPRTLSPQHQQYI
ncbi:hypothetical protein [Nostoc sp.]